MYLPLHIDLRGKSVLVIGFGEVGKRRADKLSRAGARVSVIDRRGIKVKGPVKFTQKNLTPSSIPSLKEYFLVVAATDDKRLNAAIARKGRSEGCLVNRVDSFRGGDVIFPAVAETRAGTISFSTLGNNPRLSKLVKEMLEHGSFKD